MKKNYSIPKGREVVFWGMGEIQTDIKSLYNIDVFAYIYNEDDIAYRNKDTFCYSRQEYLGKSFCKDHYLIICEELENDIRYFIKNNHLVEFEDYIIGNYLLINHIAIEEICRKRLVFYGKGNTYEYFKDDLNKYIAPPERFLVTRKNDCDNEVIGLEEYEFSKEDFVIVSSVYYDEIGKALEEKGLKRGKDYLHIYTFFKMLQYARNITTHYRFDNRKKNKEKLLVILAGYKPFVWKDVFERLKHYVPDDIDVCIVTSGLVNEKLRLLCQKNEWSYVSTKQNNVSLAVNTVVYLHENAKMVYKIDEDIFVTKGVFEKMLETYYHVQQDSFYETAFVTPMIPVNGFGYVDVLEQFGCVEEWKKRFGDLKYTDCYHHHKTIHDTPEAARMMWGEGVPKLSNIDEMNKELQSRPFAYHICPVRYSIGLILFSRDNWIAMDMFPVDWSTNMGADEIHICKYALMNGKVMVETGNALVGHLSYGPQHESMEKYYYQHPECFRYHPEYEEQKN